MKILAFDTATALTTTAISVDGVIRASAQFEGAMSHGELLAPAIDQVLKKSKISVNELTDIAVGVGPGPFTGLRVGVVTALTLAHSLGIAAHGVCTLDVIAADIDDPEFFVMTDARRKEVYWAKYRNGKRTDGPNVGKATDIELNDLPAFGRGAVLYGLSIDNKHLDPQAATLARGITENQFEHLPLEPLYLRRPDITMPAKTKQA